MEEYMSTVTPGEKPNIFQILRGAKLIGESTLRTLAHFVERWGISQFAAVLETNTLGEAALADALSAALNLTKVSDVSTAPLTPEAMELLPYDRLHHMQIMPLRISGHSPRCLELIVADPTQYDVLEKLAVELKCEFEISVAPCGEILRALEELWPIERQLPILQSL